MINDSDIHGKVLYDDGEHKYIWLGADADQKKGVVQTNQYLIIDKGKGVLLDPGGVHLFSRVVAVASRFIDLSNIESIFFSHQDPDVSSGIALWLGVTNAVIYVSDLWIRFLPHFGIVDGTRIRGIEDVKRTIKLPSGSNLSCVPAHFLHSAGCYCLYDKRAKNSFQR